MGLDVILYYILRQQDTLVYRMQYNTIEYNTCTLVLLSFIGVYVGLYMSAIYSYIRMHYLRHFISAFRNVEVGLGVKHVYPMSGTAVISQANKHF